MSFDTLLSILFVVAFIVLPLLSRAFRQRGPTAGRGNQPRPGGGQPPQPTADRSGGSQDTQAPPWLADAQRRVREAQAQRRGGGTAEASAAPRERPLVPEDPFGRAGTPAGDTSMVPSDPFGRPQAAPSGRTLVPEDPYRRQAEPPAERTLVPDDPFRQPAPPRPGTLVAEDPYQRGLANAPGAAGSAPPHADDTLGREGLPVPRVRPTTAPTPAGGSGEPARTAAGGRRRRRTRTRAGEAGSAATGGITAGLVMAAYVRRRGTGGGARLGPVDLLRFDRQAVVSGLIWHEILDEPAWKRRQRRALSRPRSR